MERASYRKITNANLPYNIDKVCTTEQSPLSESFINTVAFHGSAEDNSNSTEYSYNLGVNHLYGINKTIQNTCIAKILLKNASDRGDETATCLLKTLNMDLEEIRSEKTVLTAYPTVQETKGEKKFGHEFPSYNFDVEETQFAMDDF